MTQAAVFWTATLVAGALAGYGAYAERRDKRRKDLDKISLVNWSLVTVIGTAVALLFLVYALKVSVPGWFK